MGSEWNRVTSEKEIKTYLESEIYYLPTKNYYHDPYNLNIRKFAVSVISKYWRVLEIDAFVPYLAMTYFDNFASQSHDPFLDIDEVSLIAITCLFLAAKIRNLSRRVFLDHIYDDFKREAVVEMAKEVQNKISYFMRPITPFCFLEFYYPNFKIFGEFKRRTINKIIIQAQGGKNDFVDCKFSDIAFSTFLAATHILYPRVDFHLIDKPDSLTRCDEKLIDLCKKNGIGIENVGFRTTLTSSIPVPIIREKSKEIAPDETEIESVQRRPGKEVVEASESDRKRKAKGKAVMVEPDKKKEEKKDKSCHDPLRHCPKQLMDFMLLWPRDDPFAVKERSEDSDDDEDKHTFEFPILPSRMQSS
ncbi:putative cyclin [Lupinus albus]|uniref:B-like cyclin n=1 Tax=Lupinus albus TaxID=3870 RepID=A0A6A4MMD1_LUPAL|nr:putative cyclin [Lupinus albus]